MGHDTYEDYKKIVCEDIPLIDVRAPIEYVKGAFKNTVNLPLLNNEERHMVGICYRQHGREEAVRLGEKLVSGEVKERRVSSWISYIEKNPGSIIYCYRGGLRSKISRQWIKDLTGKEIPRLDGGYKKFRNYLLKVLDPDRLRSIPVQLGGCTGAGKTKLIRKLENSIDLEETANHRGSSFGRFIDPQPTQISFENNLAYALIKHDNAGYRYMILEDESRNIGRCYLPKPLVMHFNTGNLVILEKSFDERVQSTLKEYVTDSQRSYNDVFGEEHGSDKWAEYIADSLVRIRKRLGMERYRHIAELFCKAFEKQKLTGDYRHHRNWIEILLKDYYDPMYNHQTYKRDTKIVFRGDAKDVERYLKEIYLVKL